MPSYPQIKLTPADNAATLAQRLSEALVRERVVPRFVDSYVEQHSRYGLQVHAALYRDLLALLQREALITISVRALELVNQGGNEATGAKLIPLKKREAAAFRQKYISAMTRQQKWNASDALDFQSDLRMYEEIIARAATPQRRRKSFEVANHPFVDRCAFVLDSSFMEKARVAASQTLTDLESLTLSNVEAVLQGERSWKP
jgi:hypothetical protein